MANNPDLTRARPAFRRRAGNGLATFGMGIGVSLTVLPVALILFYVVWRGLPAMSWDFLTKSMPHTFRRLEGGYLNGLVGTALMVGIATLVSVPLGILSAVYLVEYGRTNPLARLIRFVADIMTGVPSVFVGLFVYAAFVASLGFGALLGAIALAIVMLPIIVRSTEEMLKLVPRDLKDASYALGAAKWQTILRVVLPSALPGIVTGVMLAVARAAGETAPLVLTALGAQELTAKLVGQPIASLTLAIFRGAQNPFAAGQAQAWAGALELLVIVLILTLIARVASSRSRIRR